MKKILVIGNGAREHAIALALKRSPQEPEIFVYMKSKNPGMARIAKDSALGKLDDFSALGSFVEKVEPDFAFIGPEGPLSSGVVDFLEGISVKSVGPVKELAKLETSKAWTRNLLKKYDIPGNIKFGVFKGMDGVREFLAELGEFVVKPDGLTGGKGVKVSGDHLHGVDDAAKYCEEVLGEHECVVIEEKLVGEEFSLQCFVDGRHVKATPPVQDHKRLLVGDRGPNTGGMGSYSCSDHLLPFLTKEEVEQATRIVQQTCDAIKQETGQEYKGIMYGGFILTRNGLKLLEYNARLGDPEAMNILPILKTDFVQVCEAVVNGNLDEISMEFEDKATVCKYVVPDGYPTNPASGEKIEIDESDPQASVYYASVDQREDGLYMTGSRAIAFVGIGPEISDAEKTAEEAIISVKGPVTHRPDIGTPELLQKRVDHMNEIRSA